MLFHFCTTVAMSNTKKALPISDATVGIKKVLKINKKINKQENKSINQIGNIN